MKQKLVWIGFAIVALALVGAALYPFITNPTSVTQAYTDAGAFAPILFIILVIVAPTPGAIIGVSGAGYFGLPQAAIYLYIGNLLGVSITFLLVRQWGRPVAERFVKKEKLAEYDGFVKRHPILQWVVYTVPIFPIELITFVIALSGKRFRDFFRTVALALPIYALFVTTVGWQLSTRYQQALEYASIGITIVILYSVLHFLYVWKKEVIQETGRKIGREVKRGVNRVEQEVTKFADATTKLARRKK